MQGQIIYSTTRSVSCFEKLFSCLNFLRPKDSATYQFGPIDSPKGSVIDEITQIARKTVVLDLDETLVHSQFQMVEGFDFSIEVIIQIHEIVVQGVLFKVYVTVRPGATTFIETLAEHYEVILWTASLKEYADPVMDQIDPNQKCTSRMYRDSCTLLRGGLTKNLNRLNRDLKDVLIIDNSALSFQLQPDNAYHIRDFLHDKEDRDLDQLLPFMIWLAQQSDVRPVHQQYSYFQNNPQSVSLSKKASFMLNQQQLEMMQYEEQGKRQIMSHSLTIARKVNQARTLTLEEKALEYADDDPELREQIGINSPHGEPVKEQTDDEERETVELNT